MKSILPYTLLLPMALVLSLLPACGKHDADTLPRPEAASLVIELTGAPLPPDATHVYASSAALFNAAVDVRFECSLAQLDSFLAASPHLPDELTAGDRTVVDSMCDASWWQPDRLEAVRGSEQSWQTETDTVFASLLCGEAESPGRVIVYLAVTIESRRDSSDGTD